MTSAPQKKYWTVEEYFAFDAEQEARWEYDHGEVFMMAGATREHTRISGNTYFAFRLHFRERDCEVYSSEMRVRVYASDRYTYPDIVAVCGEQDYDETTHTLNNPLVVIEVSSPSTELYDRTRKLFQYQRCPSLQEYVLIAQREPRIESYTRQPNGSWVHRWVEGLASSLLLESIGCALLLSDVYRNVTFEPSSDDVPGA